MTNQRRSSRNHLGPGLTHPQVPAISPAPAGLFFVKPMTPSAYPAPPLFRSRNEKARISHVHSVYIQIILRRHPPMPLTTDEKLLTLSRDVIQGFDKAGGGVHPGLRPAHATRLLLTAAYA